MKVKCKTCGKYFEKYDHNRRSFCSPKCRKNYEKSLRPKRKTCQATTGAISEYLVVSDLLKNGFNVYRSVSPSAPVDMIAIKSNKIFRVEVKTAVRWPSTGKLNFGSPKHEYDILAKVVLEENLIVYDPDLNGI